MTEIAQALPAKEFFIRMITKDISLDDSILDLLDNSVDAARKTHAAAGGNGLLSQFTVDLAFDEDNFKISDNCGGMSIADAKDKAFHFGRRKDPDPEDTATIGVYGIGMKRAVFKLGKRISLVSSTATESFHTTIDVDAWEAEPTNWTFELDVGPPSDGEAGLSIEITDLREGVGTDLSDPEFVNRLRRSISRDYSLFLQNGLSIIVNGQSVEPEIFALLEGGDFKPARLAYTDGEVTVDVVAGMAAPPPEDDSAQAEIPHHRRYGWYVVCNDRVVLAGDQTDKTVWNHDGFNTWHNQYNGFVGIVSFHCANPERLPWTTTKRGIDQTDSVYRRAVERMKKLTKTFIDYTNARKTNTEEAKAREKQTKPKPVSEIEIREQMLVPSLAPKKRKWANILYKKPLEDVRRAAEALGNRNMNYKEVGERTFDYFMEREASD